MPHLMVGSAMSKEMHAPFRPRRAPRVAYPFGVAWLVLMLVLAIFLPIQLGVLDRLAFVAVGALGLWFLHRQASVAAVPSAAGLRVRNLFLSQDLEWAQIVGVRFGGGAPWVSLDLADGDTLAVMAIQRADGEFAVEESRRLATLVAAHSQTERDD